MRTVLLEQDSLGEDLDFSPLHLPELDFVAYPATAPEQARERIADAEVVMVNKLPLTAELLAGASHLRLICVVATGTNNIDLAAAAERGIAVCNCRGYGTNSVAQHVLALMLALSVRLWDYQKAVLAGAWQRADQFCLLDYPIRELNGATLGIVGYGELGRRVAELASGFGMRVVVARRPGAEDARPDRLPLDELLGRVDVLSLHCPLTESTRGLIGARELGLMKRGSLLINAARGGIVDESALADALRRGHLGGAGVDVLTEEPPRSGNPLLAGDIPNLIVTPHCAWGSREARQCIVEQTAENIRGFLEGAAVRRVL